MASVTLKNVVKEFKSVIAVDHLSIEIQDREFAVLVGAVDRASRAARGAVHRAQN